MSRSRARRAAVGAAIVLALALGSSLAGCSTGPEATTCGDVTSMSADDRVALLDDLAGVEGDRAGDWADLDAEERGARAERLLAACADVDADTRLSELDQV